ncbi:unnamed protein product [Microthlaspi erraticum]|uniref:Uncharacterized protein n=1 Tax=Microthlaspi erraticum TaxID=1685480 RepID=A0A6D2I4W7_9BRAS|nr:unnamed protein product [Microthlaspi erraticum]
MNITTKVAENLDNLANNEIRISQDEFRYNTNGLTRKSEEGKFPWSDMLHKKTSTINYSFQLPPHIVLLFEETSGLEVNEEMGMEETERQSRRSQVWP